MKMSRVILNPLFFNKNLWQANLNPYNSRLFQSDIRRIVAQAGERLVDIEEVGSSILPDSTILFYKIIIYNNP